ncbi:MAG: hydrogenase maturation protease [Candidatus Eisenbacteria bacterium]
MAAKGILIGLGNPIMSDDGIGLLVARRVHQHLPSLDLDLSCAGGFDIIDRILGREMAVIVDSMVTGQCPPGEVRRLDVGACRGTLRSRDSHTVGFSEAIRLARACGAALPSRIVVYGIEVEDPFSVGDRVSETLAGKLDSIVDDIVRDLRAEGLPAGPDGK